MIRMNRVAAEQLYSLEIARTEDQIAVSVIRHFDQQSGAVNLQLIEGLTESLGLHLLEAEGIDHNQLAVGELGGQSRTQRTQQLLARKSVVVRTRLWTMHRATVPPQWRANGADSSTSGALLLPKFLAGAGNQLLVLGGVSASAVG